VSAPAAHPHWHGYALATGGAVAFSAKAIVAKLLYRHGIDALDAVALRMLLSCPFFLAMAWWGGRGKPALTAADWRRVALLGLSGYYVASMLDFYGLQFITASLERLILFVYPTIVVLIVALRQRRPVAGRQALALAVSYGGVLLAFGQEAAASMAAGGATTIAWGALLVLGSALSYAIYLILSGETVARFGALRLTGLASLVASALCLGQYFLLRPANTWLAFAPAVWEFSLVNALACTVVPLWMVMRAMELIGSAHTAQMGMVGPISTLLLSVWLLQEPFTAPLALGTLLVLAGTALLLRRGPASIKESSPTRESTPVTPS